MFDIRFFQKIDALKTKIVREGRTALSVVEVAHALETARDPRPHVCNVETTNVCNMKCKMCPRTTLMSRGPQALTEEDFVQVLDQVRPHSPEELQEFWKFITSRYDMDVNEKSENGFYFSVVARCLILHGYGEPLLDPQLVNRVREATARNIPTYLSCVPANLTVARAEALMQAGLTVLKVSIDGLNDEAMKAIRGPRNNFQESFRTVLDVLNLKKEKGFKTLIVPTMISFSESPEAREQHRRFLELWEGRDAWAYVKSQDNRWLYEEKDEKPVNRSHYAAQFCEQPWLALTVMANGDVVPCMQDYNTELKLGNIHEQTLEEIWNGEAYRRFREYHVTGNFPPGHKCVSRCDQKKIYQYLTTENEVRSEEPTP